MIPSPKVATYDKDQKMSTVKLRHYTIEQFGPDDPDTLEAVDNLVSVCYAQGRNDHAEVSGKRALAGKGWFLD